MKIIAVGDIHGRHNWRDVVANHHFDKIVFIGDYFDSFTIPGDAQIENFRDIIKYKELYPDRVVLLIGNHDLHYLDMNERYSGYQKGYQYMIRSEVEANLHHLQMCYAHQEFLFTHAGVTRTWARMCDIDLDNIEQSINDRWKYKPTSFIFLPGPKGDGFGDEICQGPLWVRPKSLMQDAVPGWCHVVGHTAHRTILMKDTCIFVDVLDYSQEILVIEDGEAKIHDI